MATRTFSDSLHPFVPGDHGPLTQLLAQDTQTSNVSFDFSGLDVAAFRALSDAAARLLEDRRQDADLRRILETKAKVTQSRLDRTEKERERERGAAELACRSKEKLKAHAAVLQSQLDAIEVSRRQGLQELAKTKREIQATKAAARQARLCDERSMARQREKFVEASIFAVRKSASRSCIVAGIFDQVKGASARSAQPLLHQQLEETESQRDALATSNSALRRLATEAFNALRSTLDGIPAQEHADLGSVIMQSDLFPPGRMLSKDYDLDAKEASHPAVMTLSRLIELSQRAVYGLQKDFAESRLQYQSDVSENPTKPSCQCATRESSIGLQEPQDYESLPVRDAQLLELRMLRDSLKKKDLELRLVSARLEEARGKSNSASEMPFDYETTRASPDGPKNASSARALQLSHELGAGVPQSSKHRAVPSLPRSENAHQYIQSNVPLVPSNARSAQFDKLSAEKQNSPPRLVWEDDSAWSASALSQSIPSNSSSRRKQPWCDTEDDNSSEPGHNRDFHQVASSRDYADRNFVSSQANLNLSAATSRSLAESQKPQLGEAHTVPVSNRPLLPCDLNERPIVGSCVLSSIREAQSSQVRSVSDSIFPHGKNRNFQTTSKGPQSSVSAKPPSVSGRRTLARGTQRLKPSIGMIAPAGKASAATTRNARPPPALLTAATTTTMKKKPQPVRAAPAVTSNNILSPSYTPSAAVEKQRAIVKALGKSVKRR